MATFAKHCLAEKAILITGGLGAIGTLVVTRLAEHPANVVVNDLLANEEAEEIIREAS